MRFDMPFQAFFEISLTSVTDIDFYISSGILTVTSSVRRHGVVGVLFLSENCKLFYVNVSCYEISFHHKSLTFSQQAAVLINH